MFPAYVGMSPKSFVAPFGVRSVPRIRGDEPGGVMRWRDTVVCSPHTWG